MLFTLSLVPGMIIVHTYNTYFLRSQLKFVRMRKNFNKKCTVLRPCVRELNAQYYCGWAICGGQPKNQCPWHVHVTIKAPGRTNSYLPQIMDTLRITIVGAILL